MPLSVLQGVRVDYSVPLDEIAPLLDKLSRQTADEEGRYPVPDEIEIESRIAEQRMESDELLASVEKIGRISKLTGPDCNGALWEINDLDISRPIIAMDQNLPSICCYRVPLNRIRNI